MRCRSARVLLALHPLRMPHAQLHCSGKFAPPLVSGLPVRDNGAICQGPLYPGNPMPGGSQRTAPKQASLEKTRLALHASRSTRLPLRNRHPELIEPLMALLNMEACFLAGQVCDTADCPPFCICAGGFSVLGACM